MATTRIAALEEPIVLPAGFVTGLKDEAAALLAALAATPARIAQLTAVARVAGLDANTAGRLADDLITVGMLPVRATCAPQVG